MISKEIKVLIEEYCMGVRPTDEQLNEIVDAAIASSSEPMEVGKYIDALQNGPTKEEAKRKAEEEAKRKAEEETRRKAEDAKRKAEEEAKRKAGEETKRKAEEEKKRQENMPKAKELYDRGKAKTKGFFSANYKEARALFEESLALGYGDAAYEIAEMYKIGIGGCEKNLQEYLRLIDRGIELHSSYVAEQAAKDFRIGSGVVPKDEMKSAMYEGIATGIGRV
jgi:TPR repeat protein